MVFGKAREVVLSEKLVLYMNRASIILRSVALFLLAQVVCWGQNIDTSLDRFGPALRALQKQAIKGNLTAVEIAAAKLAAKASRPEDSWPSILQLWVAEQRDFVELLWWQKDDRETRAFVVALFWCSQPPPREDVRQWPASIADFTNHASRFDSTEKSNRIDEARFVRKHLSAVAKELALVLQNSVSSNSGHLLKQYMAVADKGEGDRLP
jgi:hypothetical protein